VDSGVQIEHFAAIFANIVLSL